MPFATINIYSLLLYSILTIIREPIFIGSFSKQKLNLITKSYGSYEKKAFYLLNKTVYIAVRKR